MLKDRAAIQHPYTVGPTGSGKTHVIMNKARAVRMAGYPVYVCTAKARPELAKMLGGLHPDVKKWKAHAGASVVTHEKDYFPRLYWAGQLGPCMIVFDEAGIDIGENAKPEIVDMFRLCRDQGIMIAVNAQTYTAVDRQVRTQCKECFLFNVGNDDMRYVLKEYRFNQDSEQTIKRATDLGLYEHLHVDTRNRVAEIVDRNGKAT